MSSLHSISAFTLPCWGLGVGGLGQRRHTPTLAPRGCLQCVPESLGLCWAHLSPASCCCQDALCRLLELAFPGAARLVSRDMSSTDSTLSYTSDAQRPLSAGVHLPRGCGRPLAPTPSLSEACL